jgi:5,10-methylene-tetrahydrofolate dehydrogenase/methenyl tetrahydrofolate cyclohydrolase
MQLPKIKHKTNTDANKPADVERRARPRELTAREITLSPATPQAHATLHLLQRIAATDQDCVIFGAGSDAGRCQQNVERQGC